MGKMEDMEKKAKVFTQEEIDDLKIWAFEEHAFHDATIVEQLKNSFVVFYSDHKNAYFFRDILSYEDKIALINSLIRQIQGDTNYSREIVAVSGNVFYVY
jgi:hypothetical protein